MLEWKILAAGFSALLVISILLVGNSGVSGLFGGIFEKITEWMGGSPISLPGGSGGKSSGNMVSIALYPRNFTLSPGSKLNLTLGESYFQDFNGDVSFDFQSAKILLKEKSGFSVSSPLQTFTIQNLSLSKLTLTNMKFDVHAQSDISNDNGNMTIQSFFVMLSLGNSSILLEGNVTKITGDGWSVG